MNFCGVRAIKVLGRGYFSRVWKYRVGEKPT
jgi:hypothetical protein